jgi:hypothetical protein
MMGTLFIHTTESAKQVLKDYRDHNAHDTLSEALDSMEGCYDDLDNEERSALNKILKNPALLDWARNTKPLTIKNWCVVVAWSDGTNEYKTDVDLPKGTIASWEMERNE